MSRSIRRHQQAVAKLRRLRIIRYNWFSSRYVPNRLWRQFGKLMMNEPGWWVHEFMTRPARARDAHACRLIECGRSPDEFVWGDNRKPHKYYW
jgi:hypothetical protein